MSWHVRYIDRELKHELLSPELPSREAAFEAAWDIAQGPHDIVALEGPDEETVTVEEIGSWFDRRAPAPDLAIAATGLNASNDD